MASLRSFFSRLTGGFTKPKAAPTKAIGVPGTIVLQGYVEERESDARLIGERKYCTYSEMLANNLVVAVSVRLFLRLISRSTLTAVPADTSDGQEMADLLIEILNDMETPLPRVVKRSAMYQFYGFQVQEWISKKRPDGVIGFADVQPRAQETIRRWDLDDLSRVEGVTQRLPLGGEEVYLPRSKIVYIVDDSLNASPEGVGLFRHCVSATARLAAFEYLEGVGFETDLRGIPVGYTPIADMQQAGLSDVQINQINAGLNDFVTNRVRTEKTGVILDSATYTDFEGKPSSVRKQQVELLRGGSSNQAEVGSSIMRLNKEIARLFGAEGLYLGDTGSGSLALSKDKTRNLLAMVDSVMTEITTALDRDLVRVLWKQNGWNEESMPKLAHKSVSFTDALEQAEILSELAKAGGVVLPNDPAVNEVRVSAGLSPIPEEMMNEIEEQRMQAQTDALISELPERQDEDEEDVDNGVAEGDE